MNSTHKIILIACAGKKLTRRAKAETLYNSELFKRSLRYAKKLHAANCANAIYILSAKHRLLALDREIEPYDKTLNTMPAAEVKAWADEVLTQLREICDLNKTEFIFLAGKNYQKYLTPALHWQDPLAGLRIGRRLQRLAQLYDD